MTWIKKRKREPNLEDFAKLGEVMYELWQSHVAKELYSKDFDQLTIEEKRNVVLRTMDELAGKANTTFGEK